MFSLREAEQCRAMQSNAEQCRAMQSKFLAGFDCRTAQKRTCLLNGDWTRQKISHATLRRLLLARLLVTWKQIWLVRPILHTRTVNSGANAEMVLKSRSGRVFCTKTSAP